MRPAFLLGCRRSRLPVSRAAGGGAWTNVNGGYRVVHGQLRESFKRRQTPQPRCSPSTLGCLRP